MEPAATQRLDDLRRFAAALAAGVGLAPARASALASQLLWFDAAGAPDFGIAALPELLGRIDRGEVDPRAEGVVRSERAATLNLDGKEGVAPLILARASALAAEKARDVGVGLVRVSNLGPSGPTAAIAAEAAIGPEIALVLGPDARWSLAVPSPEGLPLVVDTALGGAAAPVPAEFAPWALLAPEGGYLVAAVAIRALEPLGTFHERVLATIRALPESPGLLKPEEWEVRRRSARERGVAVGPRAMGELLERAERLGIPPPGQGPGR